MEKNLSNILNECLIVPYPEEQVEKLIDLGEQYALTVDRVQIETCIRIFLFNDNASRIVSFMEENIADKDISLPPIVVRVMAGIIVYKALTNSKSNLTDKEKEIASLYTRNFLLEFKGHYADLIGTPIIKKIISISEVFRNDLSEMEEVTTSQLIPNIFSAETFEEAGVTDLPTLFDEVKLLCQQYERTNYNEITVRYLEENECDPFILAVKVAKNLSTSPHWTYVDSNPIKTIMTIFEKRKKSSVKLSKIKDRVKDTVSELECASTSDSSLLIHYLKGESTTFVLDEIKLNPLVFAIYLYYELFLERIILEDNGE